ncbi:MAG: hypothetical protein WDN47_02160 [Candidatus Doudnabacteria bacterium]
MYKAGTITLVAPSLGTALAVNGGEKWLVQQNRRGQFIQGLEQPELTESSAETRQRLPIRSEVIYFIEDENDPAAVKLWATKQDYLDIEEIIRQRKESDQQKEEMASRPKIRVMEQLIERGILIGEAKPVINEIFLDDFLRQYSIIRRHDTFATSGDFYQTRKRWFEQLTPEGWVQTPDPRRKL